MTELKSEKYWLQTGLIHSKIPRDENQNLCKISEKTVLLTWKRTKMNSKSAPTRL
jgi:hypothetical protein